LGGENLAKRPANEDCAEEPWQCAIVGVANQSAEATSLSQTFLDPIGASGTADEFSAIAPAPASSSAHGFYAGALDILCASGIPFLIAGTYALNAYTGLRRQTKDIDVFCKPGDYPKILHLFRSRATRPRSRTNAGSPRSARAKTSST
jgi:hypothetical protein